MDPTWAPVVVDFLRQSRSQVMNPFDMDFQSMKLLEVSMVNSGNEARQSAVGSFPV
ncbi:hypothetical protein IC582_012902 [Cucumis melo]